MTDFSAKRSLMPLVAAVTTAVIGLVTLLILDHGPGSDANAASLNFAATARAVSAAGATLTPTPSSRRDKTAPLLFYTQESDPH